MFGLTIDNVEDEEKVIAQLRAFKTVSTGNYRPVVRLVFDVYKKGEPWLIQSQYKSIIQKIKQDDLAYVMGAILDSQAVYACRNRTISFKDCYLQRTKNLYDQLKKKAASSLLICGKSEMRLVENG